MYVAAAADKIFASEVSLVGSVGVLAPTFMNFSKTLDKLGIETLTITAGKDKDAMNPLRPWKEGEDQNYRDIIDYYYKHFVDIVVTSRPQINKTKLIDEYGAHVFPAPGAQERGFIDVSGASRDDVINDLVKKLDIENNYAVVELQNKGWWASLFSGQSPLFTGTVKHQLHLNSELDPAIQGKYLYLYQPQ
jgi:protease-4